MIWILRSAVVIVICVLGLSNASTINEYLNLINSHLDETPRLPPFFGIWIPITAEQLQQFLEFQEKTQQEEVGVETDEDEDGEEINNYPDLEDNPLVINSDGISQLINGEQDVGGSYIPFYVLLNDKNRNPNENQLLLNLNPNNPFNNNYSSDETKSDATALYNLNLFNDILAPFASPLLPCFKSNSEPLSISYSTQPSNSQFPMWKSGKEINHSQNSIVRPLPRYLNLLNNDQQKHKKEELQSALRRIVYLYKTKTNPLITSRMMNVLTGVKRPIQRRIRLKRDSKFRYAFPPTNTPHETSVAANIDFRSNLMPTNRFPTPYLYSFAPNSKQGILERTAFSTLSKPNQGVQPVYAVNARSGLSLINTAHRNPAGLKPEGRSAFSTGRYNLQAAVPHFIHARATVPRKGRPYTATQEHTLII